MADEDTRDAAYWEAEAKKAFAQRDKFQAKLETVEQRLTSETSLAATEKAELERLRKIEADAEEKRRLEAGEFEAAKQALLEQKAEAEAKAAAAEQRFANKVVESAFANASGLFGPNGRTVLTPEFAYAGMGSHVEFVPGENGSGGGLVVKDTSGEIIRGEDGQPASFEKAMETLIETWPGKEQILRAGHKAGSGSAGGSGEAVLPVDRAELVQRANAGDQAAIAALRASQPTGRVTHGGHWDKLADVAATTK